MRGVREAGEEGAGSGISKVAGAKLNTGREPGLKGTGSGRFRPPCPPLPLGVRINRVLLIKYYYNYRRASAGFFKNLIHAT